MEIVEVGEGAPLRETTFHGVINYLSRRWHIQGTNWAELASVTKPQNLATLDGNNLDRVITVS